MSDLGGDEKLELKAVILELVVHYSGMFGNTQFISKLDDRIPGFSEAEIRAMAEELDDSFNWVKYENDAVIVPNRHQQKAKNEIQEMRRDAYSTD